LKGNEVTHSEQSGIDRRRRLDLEGSAHGAPLYPENVDSTDEVLRFGVKTDRWELVEDVVGKHKAVM